MDGTVKELHLLVPHSWIYLDVKDAKRRGDDLGARSHRSQAGSPKVGVKREDVKPGDADQGPVSSAQGRLQRLPARVCHAHAPATRQAARPRGREIGTAAEVRDA